MIKAVIFDLDGLLVDSKPVWFQVRTKMFARFALQWTDDDQKALMGRSTQAWIDYVHQKLNGKLTKDEIVNETLSSMVSQYRSGNVRFMPAAQQALDNCAGKFKLGLASSSPRILIDAALKANSWQKYFSQVLSSDEVPNGKPAPDAYLEVMKRLGVKPNESVVVEDSGSGIIAGKAAGATVIAVPNEHLMPSPEALKSADVVLESLVSLNKALTEITTRAGIKA
ncbi:MAG: HAD family phosphatase [Ignavibacteriae bacterium]|nr:HAD family phosphatase [Ignavibacteriota bacterium]